MPAPPPSSLPSLDAAALDAWQHAPAGMAWVDADGRLGACNAAFQLACAAPVPGSLAELLGGADRAAEAWSQLRSGRPWSTRLTLQQTPCELQLSWPDGAPQALLSVWPLLHTPPDANALAAQLGHELRTPLSGVISLTELVLSSELGDRQRKLLDMALLSARQLLELINHQLDLAKLEAGALQLSPRPFALHDCLRDALQPLLAQAHAKGVALQARVQPGVPHRLVADDLRLRQVLANLVGNALKFTAQGQVRIDVHRGSGPQRLALSVTDTGVGMTPEQQRQLFQPFAQAHAGVARQYGGTGLGLVISQRLVRLMGGGAIAVESSPGIGSCFRFDIAVQAALEAA